MTSGLNDRVPDPNCTIPECLIYKSDTGTRWAYHTAPYSILDNVIERDLRPSSINLLLNF